ncbi:hypothetical protein ELH53_32735 (plasmid) [Rhizobium ruizarguesonis]|uniref:hypothetical protein n=1 Tax=Rhizobium ruizarguesonis TaxID=2081791 RepID=UPI0010302D48|nr:hypothetical protein [Rhizobium ruizarguesonis]MBY5855932.1 hypothetical protein [Rhizobium leguminosarum]TBA76673.1 hypothetical protein ELH53_32735 [Rhizobium ruizarguesonis]
MVQVVFVHGVANRKTDVGFEASVAARDRRFKELGFAAADFKIRNPYWGEFGADPQWKLASVPKFDTAYQALGIGGVFAPAAANGSEILEAARVDFPAVIGGLSVTSLSDPANPPSQDQELFWMRAAKYAVAQPKPAWLTTVNNDAEFCDRLRKEAEAGAAVQGLGFLDRVKEAADKLKGGASNLVNSPFARAGREKITPSLAIFIGDVFRYLREDDARTRIRDAVIGAIVAAAKERKAGEPLVLIGHSMGGVILYDLLSSDKTGESLSKAIGSQFEVDLLLTVGSQVALFEEMKLYQASSAEFSGQTKPVLRPKVVKTWWNAFDKMDVLSFVTKPIFQDTEDFSVDTIAGVLDAHGAYFSSTMFYARLNARLKNIGLVP